MKLTEEQWSILEPLLPKLRRRDDGKGRPWRNNREVLEGVLWVLKTGARWMDLPKEYPPYQTCHRRFQLWEQDGVIDNILEKISHELFERGVLDLSESFIDGTFAPAKKGANLLEKPRKAKGQRSWGSRMLKVFLSDYALKVLHDTRLSLLKKQLKVSTLPTSVQCLSVTKHTILTALTRL
jgi:transposase